MSRGTWALLGLAVLAVPAEGQEDLLAACAATEIRYTPAPPALGAENAETQFRFLCGQVAAALTNAQPIVGIAFTGGAHTLGTFTTIGRRFGIPRISGTARVNAALAEVPSLLDDYRPSFDEEGRIPAMGTSTVPVASLQADVVVGLVNGFSGLRGLGGLGSVDLLGSLSFLPAVDELGLDDPVVNWGVGARVGILRQGLVLPGISVSGMYRRMSEVSFGDLAAGDPAQFSADLTTASFRAGASKGILAFDLAAGVGYDIYWSDVDMDWELACPAGAPPSGCGVETRLRPFDPSTGEDGVSGELRTAAWNAYGNIGFGLLLLNVVAEVGYQQAVDRVTLADLRDAGLPERAPTTEDLARGRLFGSLGLRVSF